MLLNNPTCSVSVCDLASGQVSKTRLEWLRRLRMDIAALLAVVTSVMHSPTLPWYAPQHSDQLHCRKRRHPRSAGERRSVTTAGG